MIALRKITDLKCLNCHQYWYEAKSDCVKNDLGIHLFEIQQFWCDLPSIRVMVCNNCGTTEDAGSCVAGDVLNFTDQDDIHFQHNFVEIDVSQFGMSDSMSSKIK